LRFHLQELHERQEENQQATHKIPALKSRSTHLDVYSLENLSGAVVLLAHETELSVSVSVSVSVSLCLHCSDDTTYAFALPSLCKLRETQKKKKRNERV
jgi:hypothetical protein